VCKVKYWTKEWYAMCQKTGLHFGLIVHEAAKVLDEAIFQALNKEKEYEFIQMQREIYNVDPRAWLKQDGTNMVLLNKIINDEDIEEKDVMIYRMSEEEKNRIHQLIAEYDARPPFDEEGIKQAFQEQLDWKINYSAKQLPSELLAKIADIRVYALGYCTEEVLEQLMHQSEEIERVINEATEAALKELQMQHIPEEISSKLNFHDCTVIGIEASNNLVITLNTSGGFTENNRITFTKPNILLKEDGIIGKHWLYNELYRTDEGYELHVLFGGAHLAELIISCSSIVIDQYEDILIS